jgi:hypothetical protein
VDELPLDTFHLVPLIQAVADEIRDQAQRDAARR